MSQENLKIVTEAAEAINRRDRESWLASNAPDAEFRADPEWPESRWVHGREAVWDFLVEFLDVWDQAEVQPLETLPAERDKVVIQFGGDFRAKASGIVTAFDYWYVATLRDGLN
jgi:ketosteroid isomerase-like protein